MTDYSLDFPYACGEPNNTADFRTELEDFIVVENLGYAPGGEGEHLFLQIEKQNENTHWISENIARQAGVKPMDVSYCGKKDRFAITTQWFSIYAPKAQFSDEQIDHFGSENPDGSKAAVRVLAAGRHSKKLRRGEHASNSFVITLRNLSPTAMPDIERRLEQIRNAGVPNYFGEQRFGREAGNLHRFNSWAEAGRKGLKRNDKSMAISAARSWLFNRVLSQRVADGSWQEVDTGPLWGRGRLSGSEEQVAYEQSVVEPWQLWCETLEHSGLSQERRALRLIPENLVWSFDNDRLQISFVLPSGEFATALLREVVKLNRLN